MTKTTLQNLTGSDVVLREGQAQVYRRVCDIKNNDKYVVRSELNQTYKEYMCASIDNSSHQLTLSSDDLSEWKEIHITLPKSGSLTWEGKIRAKGAPPAEGATPAKGASKTVSNVVNWIRGLFPVKRAETGVTTGTTHPASANTAVLTEPATTVATTNTTIAAVSSTTATGIPAPGATTNTAPGATTNTAPGATTNTAPGATTNTAPGATTNTAPGATTTTAPGATTNTPDPPAASSATATRNPATGTTTAK